MALRKTGSFTTEDTEKEQRRFEQFYPNEDQAQLRLSYGLFE